jgi:molybdenum cofactor cytidylyltransferase
VNNEISNIALIILAAGNSSRLGKPKQLVVFNGETLLERIAREALESVCSPIIVVTGNDSETFRQRLKSYRLQIVENEHWQQGMGSSISLGIERLIETKADLDGVVLCVCDQPFVTAETINNLVRVFQEQKSKIIASEYGDVLGVPALFDKSLFTELADLDGKTGAKKIIEKYRGETFALDFPEGEIDVDTKEDLEKLRKYSQS